jgi:magnesium transporter
MMYAVTATAVILYMIFYVSPEQGTSNIFIYIGICSVAGSLSVISCKASAQQPV